MAEATITLKLAPSEFDTVRDELATRMQDAIDFAHDRKNEPSARAIQRERAARIGQLLDRLR